jgi:glycosyltransferase involved in cell wall biosynthesis
MADRRKILYVEMAHGMGGSLVSLHQLLKGLDKERYEPIVLFYWDNPFVARFRELGVETIVWSGPRRESDSTVPVDLPSAVDRPRRWLAKAAWMSKLYHGVGFYVRLAFQTLPLAWRIRKIIRQYDVDLVHANDLLDSNREVVLAARLTSRPCVCHVRAFEHYRPIDRFLGQFVDRFIFISQAIAQDSIAQGADPTKGTVIYNALDLDEYLQAFDDGSAKASLGLSASDHVVGIVGRVVPWKGQHVFLEAIRLAAETTPNLRGLIIGDAAPTDAAFKAELLALIEQLGIADRVHFLGWRSDVPRLLSTMDILVHASLEPEPFGRVLIEGMAASKPVVASNSGACPEIIQDGVSGVLVPPGDPAALAAAITGLLSNPDRLHTMGVVARHQVETRFSIAEHVRQIEVVYDDLLSA